MNFFVRIFSAIAQSRQMQAERFLRDHAHLLEQYEICIAAKNTNATKFGKTELVGWTSPAEFKLAA